MYSHPSSLRNDITHIYAIRSFVKKDREEDGTGEGGRMEAA